MAIHVRHRRETLIRMRNRLLAFALAVSLVSLLIGGTSLYLTVEYWGNTVTVFESVQYVPDGAEDSPERQSPSHSSPSAKQVSVQATVSPNLIAADAVADVGLSEMNLADGMDFGGDAGGMGGDFSLDVGSGLGNGGGLSRGGKGGGGNGHGRHGAGLNNDIQIVLLLDASGSMDALFRELSASMGRMVATLQRSMVNGRRASVNVGVVAYGAAEENGKPRKICDFTTKADRLSAALDKVRCDGSDENCGEAIAFADEEFPWNRREGNSALKVLIIAGNEPFDQGEVDFRQAIDRLRGSDIILNAVYCGPMMQETELWQEAARRGNGHFVLMETMEPPPATPLAELGQLIRRVAQLPVWPTGGPAEQAAHVQEHAKLRQAMPAKDDKLADWVRGGGAWVTEGLPWDAAEQLRRMGADASLARLGGAGNLPQTLRDRTPEAAMDVLREAAAERAQAVQALNAALNEADDLCSQILRAIRTQAQQRGIEVKL